MLAGQREPPGLHVGKSPVNNQTISEQRIGLYCEMKAVLSALLLALPPAARGTSYTPCTLDALSLNREAVPLSEQDKDKFPLSGMITTSPIRILCIIGCVGRSRVWLHLE